MHIGTADDWDDAFAVAEMTVTNLTPPACLVLGSHLPSAEIRAYLRNQNRNSLRLTIVAVSES